MRLTPALLAMMAGAAMLSACGQKTSGQPEEAAEAPPPVATPEQAKVLVATLPAPYNGGDIENGKAKFAVCAACHSVTKGGPNMTGPNLYGVFGRKSASIDSFIYSDGFRALNVTWDAPMIDKWITNPRALVKDTRMSFPGMPDPKDRMDVVAYLKVATSPVP